MNLNPDTTLLMPAIRDRGVPLPKNPVIEVPSERVGEPQTFEVILQRMCDSSTVPYHIKAKRATPAQVEKVIRNKPFERILPYIHPRYTREANAGSDEQMVKGVEFFLRGMFDNISSAGVRYEVTGGVDEGEEGKEVEAAIDLFRRSNLAGQAESLIQEYSHFKGCRKVFSLMNQNGLLRSDTILPIAFLPEMLMAAPVWFIEPRTHNLPNNENNPDPFPDDAVRFFCQQFGTQVGADIFQLYNRRTRPISKFSGRDIIPVNLVSLLEPARQAFDFVVIMTPYHDIASSEWADPNWQRSIDPYLFGFSKSIPFMFCLGRWSGTGIFPLFCDLVSDTIEHMRSHLELLENFKDNPYWFINNKPNDRLTCTNSNYLRRSVEAVLQSFDRGTLFEVLRSKASVSA